MKAEQASRIPEEWRLTDAVLKDAQNTRDLRPFAASAGILTEKELAITGQGDATSLAEQIAVGELSAVEVATAFAKRAAIAQQLCNCFTEICFLDAIEDAKRLDAHFKETGTTVGPLHGIPMTFKECFHIEGYDASNGYISRCFNKSTHTTYLIQLVKDAGAVILSKTNIPQTMLVADANNNVFGQTRNPVVSHLTCGGSSSGEGSILAFRGSALGIATDVGGSIRIPAAANGVYGFKPSSGILPMVTYANSNWPGMNTGIPAVCGPLAHSIQDMALLMSAARASKPWNFDPAVIPSVYEVEVWRRSPVVGVIRQSGLTPHPPVRRAIAEATEKLKQAGVEVKHITSSVDFQEAHMVAQQLFTIDGLSCPRAELAKSGEPIVAASPEYRALGYASKGTRRALVMECKES